MKDAVLYLCETESGTGYVFPDEMPEGSRPSGFFVISADSTGQLKKTYNFAVVYGDDEKTIQLALKDQACFQTETPQGLVTFQVGKPLEKKYIGKKQSMSLNDKLYPLRCTSPKLLDQLCRKENFYFVGETYSRKQEEQGIS
jgi:hypothetical protein